MVRDDPLDWPAPEEAPTAAEQALDRPVISATTIEEGVNAAYRLELGDDTRAVLKAATLATDDELWPEPYLLTRVSRNTEIPVPDVLATIEPDESTLGTAAFVTRYCEGRHETDVLELSPDARERLVREMGRYLAQLHDLTTDLEIADGFGELGVENGEVVVSSARNSWSARFRELTSDALAGLTGEGLLNDDEARFADLEPKIRAALEAFPPDDAFPRDIDPAVLHGDPRPANLVFAPEDDADPIVRAVLDFGGKTGDGLLELARAEDAFVDVPLGETDRADHLRGVLRDAYRANRDADFSRSFGNQYAFYRLYARTRSLAAFDFWAQFAREDDRDATARRWRSFVCDRCAEVLTD
jgi:aminoglycoside phosphotransferase (APT) family kinase protein